MKKILNLEADTVSLLKNNLKNMCSTLYLSGLIMQSTLKVQDDIAMKIHNIKDALEDVMADLDKCEGYACKN